MLALFQVLYIYCLIITITVRAIDYYPFIDEKLRLKNTQQPACDPSFHKRQSQDQNLSPFEITLPGVIRPRVGSCPWFSDLDQRLGYPIPLWHFLLTNTKLPCTELLEQLVAAVSLRQVLEHSNWGKFTTSPHPPLTPTTATLKGSIWVTAKFPTGFGMFCRARQNFQ